MNISEVQVMIDQAAAAVALTLHNRYPGCGVEQMHNPGAVTVECFPAADPDDLRLARVLRFLLDIIASPPLSSPR